MFKTEIDRELKYLSIGMKTRFRQKLNYGIMAHGSTAERINCFPTFF